MCNSDKVINLGDCLDISMPTLTKNVVYFKFILIKYT